MGRYLNPQNMTKENWLSENAQEVTLSSINYLRVREEKKYPVCLVDNGFMTAAGLAFDGVEFEAFKGGPSDHRPKRWFLVTEAQAKEFN